ncbi:hypothetical protein SAMN05444156_0672 [Verrucomicrobium sp. GAS474]|uniref:hypothetical protein n=1 Tax=Verrucomicrobium sp. GAS474 TaxID=1882831 RepID=UPI00087CA59C|nr:hypothetical protein [Verrucomicrobium sp. GAS474]SDT91197.1 hypothetical protein SAMN05444156_0672 [Verrucomicrobium sp. GAS474]
MSQAFDPQDELIPSAAPRASRPIGASSSAGSALSVDDLNLKVQQAEEVLLDLERRREQIERQKRQLEEIRRKQYEFEGGQRESVEQLRRGVVLLDQHEFDLKRECEEVALIRDSFAAHLRQLESILPQNWNPADLEDELTRALATVDQARIAYNQSQVRLEALRRLSTSGGKNARNEAAHDAAAAAAAVAEGEEAYALNVETGHGAGQGIGFWGKVGSGFAYSLPLLVGLFLLMLLWLAANSPAGAK